MSDLTELMEKLAEGFNSGEYKPLEPKDKIPFKCTGCGGCCRSTDVMLSPYDMYNLAAGLKMKPKDVFEKYLTVHRGQNSNLPVYMLKGAKTSWCDFRTKEGKCSVHKFKPKICRLYPLGALHKFNKEGVSQGESLIFLPDQDCIGMGKEIQEVGEFTKGLNLDEFKGAANNYQAKLANWSIDYDLEKMTKEEFLSILSIQIILPDELFKSEGIANVKADNIMIAVTAVMDKFITSTCSKKEQGN